MLKSFKGGIHPNYNKNKTNTLPVKPVAAPEEVIIPLRQHIGAPCTPIVNVGDRVLMGQKIGESESFVSAPVHSSVSGEVVKIEKFPHPSGTDELCVFIKNDFKDELSPTILANKVDFDKESVLEFISSVTPEEIIEKVKEAGITGMGGASFPLYVKLMPPKDTKIDTIIINGAECEPYLTADHRTMLEKPYQSIVGALLVKKSVNAKNIVIAIENNKKDAINIMKKLASDYENIKIIKLKTKYPQGSEKQLIQSCVKKQVPSGALPSSVGVLVCNVDTASAVFNAVSKNMPLIERNVTVSGNAVKEPQNLLVRVGTLFSYLFEASGGFLEEPEKIVMGGPMMGISQCKTDVPVIKGTSGVLAFLKPPTYGKDEGVCIKCGRCVDVCPMRLMPNFLTVFANLKDTEKLKEFHITDCIECGACAYICPQRRFIVQHIKSGKALIRSQKEGK